MGKNKVGNLKTKAPESAARMNFLYQAAHTILNEDKSTNSVSEEKSNSSKNKNKKSNQIVAAYYTQLMVGIGHKSVLRSSKELKRTICKGCRSLLLPGKTATVKIKTKEKRIGSHCNICKTEKLFPLNHVSKKEKKNIK